MTPEQINQTIAIHLGWTPCPKHGCRNHWVDPHGIESNLPNYHGDLNAMHEAEKTLKSIDVECYGENLAIVVIGDEYDSLNYLEVSTVAQATAAQRAEAFLRTIGKWED